MLPFHLGNLIAESVSLREVELMDEKWKGDGVRSGKKVE
jgi:hypothetical protein